MTATPIVETLANEFSVKPEHVRKAFEMIDAGLSAPFIGRFRRGDVGTMSESTLRFLQRRRLELEELDRRRGTILRMLEKEANVTPAQLEQIKGCMDRFELEDLFVPHRRPEPEVQLALDRGLGALADVLVATLPKAERQALLGIDADAKHDEESDAKHETEAAAHPSEPAESHAPDAAVDAAHAEVEAAAAESLATPDAGAAPEAGDAEEDAKEEAQPAPTLDAPVVHHPQVDLKSAMNAQLARVCAEFVRPDKGIHTELEALSGALRILSDRLGRNAALRGVVRNLLRRQGVLTVRAAADEGRMARHRALLKIKQPLRQIQGHRLLAIRQAQKERAVNTVVTLDPKVGLAKVRAALGRYTHPAYEEVLNDVALGALQYRLLPAVEADVRLELKERGDHEALRFLAQHLRQILLAPPLPRQPVLGLDVNAKGDWTVALVDVGGAVSGPDVRIETKVDGADKTPEQLGTELGAALAPLRARFVAVGHGKAPRAAATRIRAALKAAKVEAWVMLVNDSGLSSYANSELARNELADRTVPVRMAISLARRLQDPIEELLKVEPRHLALGMELNLVTKAAAKRLFSDSIESCVGLVGCDVNRASELFLSRVPGLDADAAKKIVARRAERPFASREDLRSEGLLTEAQWTNAAAFLRVWGSNEALDTTNLHPEQYPLVRKMLEGAGGSVEQMLGRPGATKGLRRVDFEVDEFTWRDLMREISFPGRDPRPRLHGPMLLEPDTDPVRLTKDRVVEGIVSNVTSFGAFVDIGLVADAMVHISEISDRYVRDARELLSIGQLVRARIVDASGARLGLSLKNVPAPERPQFGGDRPPRRRPRDGEAGEGGGGDRGPRRQGRGGGGGGRGGDRRGREEREPRQPANVRAATTRRDGIGARSSGGFGRGGGGGGGRGGPGRPGGGRPGGRGGDFGGRDRDEEHVRLSDVAPAKKPAFNPFANFFHKKDGEGS